MAYIEPNTTIDFLNNVPFDTRYENTMYFSSVSDQTSYFNSKVAYTIPKNSYQRVSKNEMRVGWSADIVPENSVIKALFKCGYMRFKNTNFENKWFYAFVDKVEYVNNNTVSVKYHIDVIQTWMFDFTFNQCLIERTHVANDSIGAHTINEGLETGPYRNKDLDYTSNNVQYSGGTYRYTPVIVLVSTFDVNGDYAPGSIIHGMGSTTWGDMYSGLHYYMWDVDNAGITACNQSLESIVNRNLIDGVVALFMGAKEFINSGFNSVSNSAKLITINTENSVDNYIPRNKKLLCYPYNMLYVSNNQGNTAEYKWEEFYNAYANNRVTLAIWGSTSVNQGLMCTPVSYKGDGYNYDESITLTGFPMCSWSNDSFKAWVAQNAGTLIAGAGTLALGWYNAIANPVGSAVSGAINGDPLGLVGGQKSLPGDVSSGGLSINPSTGLIGATLGALGQLYDHARKPPHNNGSGNGSLQYQAGLLSFSFYQKYIKSEYATIIDKFFDMYGYKVNEVGIPNLAVRPCYTYIKTVGCSIESNLPSEDVNTIEAIFDKGIRFWKTTATFGSFDPSVNNNTI